MHAIETRRILRPDDPAGDELPGGRSRAGIGDRLCHQEQRYGDEELHIGGKIGEEIRRDESTFVEALCHRKQSHRDPGDENHHRRALQQAVRSGVLHAQRGVHFVQAIAVEQGEIDGRVLRTFSVRFCGRVSHGYRRRRSHCFCPRRSRALAGVYARASPRAKRDGLGAPAATRQRPPATRGIRTSEDTGPLERWTRSRAGISGSRGPSASRRT